MTVLETVNLVMLALQGLLGITLPTLPLAGWPVRIVSLWKLAADPPPPPTTPLPWTIKVHGQWTAFEVGVRLVLSNVAISVGPPQRRKPS